MKTLETPDQLETDRLLVGMLQGDLQSIKGCGIANKDVYGKKRVVRDEYVTTLTEPDSENSRQWKGLMEKGEERQRGFKN
ncbi:MAG TPA: hypothetical protein VGE18_01225 [Candidatus Paceibacterota bacterium]